MSSNAGRGAYFKGRTRKWLLAKHWQVADLEVIRYIYPPTHIATGHVRGPIATKRDQFGADLLAMSKKRIVFIQVKGGKQAIGNGQFPAAQRAFAAFVYPPTVERWIVAWAPRARVPRVLVLTQEMIDAQEKEGRAAQEIRAQAARPAIAGAAGDGADAPLEARRVR